jgi:hypothetical protein
MKSGPLLVSKERKNISIDVPGDGTDTIQFMLIRAY